MSSKSLSDSDLSLLNKGLGFSTVPSRIPVFDIISSVESSIKHLDEEEASIFRHDIKRCLEKGKLPNTNLTKAESKSLKELKSDKTIKIVEADKGGAVVIMDTDDYNNKINTHINEYKECDR